VCFCSLKAAKTHDLSYKTLITYWMMTYVTTIISLVALIYYSVLLLIVLRQDVRRRLRLFFSLYLFSMIIWSFSSFMIFSGVGPFDTVAWNRVLVVGSMAMPLTFFGFVQAFLMKERRVWLGVGVITYITLQVLNLLGLIITSAHVEAGALINEYGDGVDLAGAAWVFFIGFSAFDLIQEYRQTKDFVYRNRLRYLILVILVIFAGTLTNLTDLRNYPGDVVCNIISALLITYAILRYHLLDITIVIRKGLLYSIPVFLIAASYYLVVILSLAIFKSSSQFPFFIFSLMVAIVSALIVEPLRRKTQSWIDRLFFREKYDASMMIQRVSQTAAFFLDLQKLTEMILVEVTSTLHIKKAAFFIKGQETGDLVLMAYKGQDKPPNPMLEIDHSIVKTLSKLDRTLTKNDLDILPQFRALWRGERENLEEIGVDLVIPLKVKGELVGIFTAGPKLSGETYSGDDQLNLTTLVNQTALAIENARLYSAEQARREELDVLYNLSRQLVVSDDVNAVLDSVISNLIKSAHVTFARILLQVESGSFFCKAVYPIRKLGNELGMGRTEPAITLPYYHAALSQGKAVLINKNNPYLNDEARRELMFNLANNLCIYPFTVGDQVSGLLVLGEARKDTREPFNADKLRLIGAIADQAGSALQRALMHEQVENSFLETVLALANAMDARDTYTGHHSQDIADLAVSMCRELACSDQSIQAVRWAALLHDIGKIGVPDQILRKEGPLNEQEWVIMKRHPEIGARIVAPVKKLANVAPIIKAHQEWFNGAGYPDGLKDEEIPFGARVISIVDAFSAMIDERVYRKSFEPAEALVELQRGRGTQFDPLLVDIFIKIYQANFAAKSDPSI
jgi:putative nucleotidyltransferase with HDIG domain